jgi:hypothetical protein
VQPGNPPLTVNPEADTATNLSADKVDGRDSTAFVSATNGKAPDSELLDGKDSTEFLGASAKAADSDKLDGKDSTDFAAASTPTAFAAHTDSVTIPDDQRVVVVSKNVPAGSYAISATVRLDNKDDNDSSFAGCSLSSGGTLLVNGGIDRLDEVLAVNASESYPMQAFVDGFNGGAITVQCSELGGAFGDSDRIDAENAAITAIRLGTVK